MTLNCLGTTLDDERKLVAWGRAMIVAGRTDVRIDCDGRFMSWIEYGKLTTYGWEIDHIIPVAAGGSDHVSNLRARHWLGNRSAGGHIGNALRQVD